MTPLQRQMHGRQRLQEVQLSGDSGNSCGAPHSAVRSVCAGLLTAFQRTGWQLFVRLVGQKSPG
jgi:hypothetical protein